MSGSDQTRRPPPDRTRVLPTVPPASGAGAGRRRRRRRPVRFLLRLVGLVLLAYLALYLVAAALAYTRVDRVDAAPDGERPPDGRGRTFLLVGSDSREGLTEEERREYRTGSAEGRRTDTVLMLHTSWRGGTLVSIPRDSLVDVPGRGEDKLNAAYAVGGPELLVQTVEGATGVRVDDYVEIGLGGFVDIVDAVGGVQVCPDRAIEDRRAGIDLPAGCQVLGGGDALGYVRARYSDPRGDLGRIERQREFLGGLADRARDPAVLLNPVAVVRVALSGGDALAVGEGTGPMDLTRFGVGLVRATGRDTVTVPLSGAAQTGAGAVLLWDEDLAEQLWAAIRNDEPVPQVVIDAQDR